MKTGRESNVFMNCAKEVAKDKNSFINRVMYYNSAIVNNKYFIAMRA